MCVCFICCEFLRRCHWCHISRGPESLLGCSLSLQVGMKFDLDRVAFLFAVSFFFHKFTRMCGSTDDEVQFVKVVPPTDHEGVQVVAVVPPTDPEPEVCDVGGSSCPVCLAELHDGARVAIFNCGHYLCDVCYGAMVVRDLAKESDNMAELVRRNEGGDKCPMCRQVTPCVTCAVAQTFLRRD